MHNFAHLVRTDKRKPASNTFEGEDSDDDGDQTTPTGRTRPSCKNKTKNERETKTKTVWHSPQMTTAGVEPAIS